MGVTTDIFLTITVLSIITYALLKNKTFNLKYDFRWILVFIPLVFIAFLGVKAFNSFLDLSELNKLNSKNTNLIIKNTNSMIESLSNEVNILVDAERFL